MHTEEKTPPEKAGRGLQGEGRARFIDNDGYMAYHWCLEAAKACE
jgi:hypothetical protein